MNDFEKYLLVSAVEIKKEIKIILSGWNSLVKVKTPALTKMNNLFTDSFTGGKYLRGTLVKLGFEIADHTNYNREILKIAAAFEILHTSLLIHDDIIDKSLTRRGKSTLHSAFGEIHYGTSQAICFGDIGFFLANKLIAGTNFSADMKTQILSEFSNIVLDTILGQMLDIKTSYDKSKREKDVAIIHKLKTAYYTISGPLSIGATLGGASQTELKNLNKFGEYLGIAFQIQDDILGVFGDEDKTGKSVISDIEENKNTLLIAYSLKESSTLQKKILNNYYGEKGISKKQLLQIKNIFRQTGALTYSQKKAKEYILKSEKFIPLITKNPNMQKLLIQFSDFITSRRK